VTLIEASLINDVFRGSIYGRYDIFTPASFRNFVRWYDVDLSRASIVEHNGTVAGAVAFALRGDRAWFALIGVRPEYRRLGYGRRLLRTVVDRALAAGARTMEFEVMQNNDVAVEMYRKIGFETIDELVIWTRSPRSPARAKLTFRKHSEPAVLAIARNPPACWQREPRSVAHASASALITCEGAYAFVRVSGAFASLLDAGARDEDSARALLRELDARVGSSITLLNEPASSALSRVLASAGWRIYKRQHRMMRRRRHQE
jgi:GNAT superfamily N-acetyltransferase